MPRPTYASIDLDAIIHNVRAIKSELIGDRKICAAVKADAYGHGAPPVARVMSAAGVDMFGVAMTEEGVELREAGISRPIVLLTTVPAGDIEEILNCELTACITEEAFARELSEQALRRGLKARAHVNVDTGMRRVGIPHTEAVDAVLRISRLAGVELTGLFTHFACSAAPEPATSREQLRRFLAVTRRLEAAGLELPTLHAANSAATLRMPESYLDCVRPGLINYGLYPHGVARKVELRPAMSLRSAVSFCKRVPAGTDLGYGHTFRTWRESVIATVPLGYHDGYLRQYSNLGEVLIRGRRAPVVGRVCMDQTLVDVTDIKGVSVGDEVVVYGRQGERCISIEEMAGLLERVPYELTCSVGSRVRRQYVLGGEVKGETPMRSVVPPALLQRIFPASFDDEDKRPTARRGAA